MHVPYKGSAAAATDLISGEVKLSFDTVSVAMPLVQSGKLKALATLSPARSSLAPDLPTIAESGISGLVTEGWMGVLAPRSTPAAIVDKLNKAITKVLQLPSVRDAFVERGVTVAIGKPEAFRDFIKAEVEKWTAVVKASGVQVE